jgi:hypothetical protein
LSTAVFGIFDSLWEDLVIFNSFFSNLSAAKKGPFGSDRKKQPL